MPEIKSYRCFVVDVFTAEALEGNPLAVFPDASDIDEVSRTCLALLTSSIRGSWSRPEPG
jgi:predicted PhzF superfamily epimerase YddE/YHI9